MRDRQRRERRLGKLGAEKRERLEGLRHATRKARLFPALQCGIYILSRRLPGDTRPEPPGRFPPRTPRRQAGQPVCRHRSRPG